jgi:hypothetical protein
MTVVCKVFDESPTPKLEEFFQFLQLRIFHPNKIQFDFLMIIPLGPTLPRISLIFVLIFVAMGPTCNFLFVTTFILLINLGPTCHFLLVLFRAS